MQSITVVLQIPLNQGSKDKANHVGKTLEMKFLKANMAEEGDKSNTEDILTNIFKNMAQRGKTPQHFLQSKIENQVFKTVLTAKLNFRRQQKVYIQNRATIYFLTQNPTDKRKNKQPKILTLPLRNIFKTWVSKLQFKSIYKPIFVPTIAY